MSKGRKPQPELIGSHPMSAGTIGKQIHLLLFDAIFHVTPSAIKLLVQEPRFESGRLNRIAQPSLGRLVTIKRGLSPLGKISALPMTRRSLLQVFRVEYSNSVKLRHGLCSLPSFIWALRLSKAPLSSWLSRSFRARPKQ